MPAESLSDLSACAASDNASLIASPVNRCQILISDLNIVPVKQKTNRFNGIN